ncbi:MAG: PKD domain-containing protein [Paludibacteraceae bacterium]|nr:PKD domain-containing protein [Paludibacteraceae bacterium]
MNKLFSKGSLIIFGSLALLVLIAWILRVSCFNVPIRAAIYPLSVEVGQPIHFCDSTMDAQMVTWEFGNGDVANKRSGDYTFNEVGQYQVRLTINDDKTLYFIVEVKDPKSSTDKKLVKIVGPSKAFQNERVVFMADGDADNWRWEFGETGRLDSEERNPIYTYSNIGTYTVKLTTSNMKYPETHTITIIPELTLDIGRPENKKLEYVRDFLQNIIDKKGEYNNNYKKIKILLKANDDLIVLINGAKENRLDAYCKNLRMIGKQNSIIIQEVAEELGTNNKIKRLLVNQNDN